MTDETKKLFDAPWKLYEYRDDYDHWFQVLTNGGRLIASRIVNKEDYTRIARLPDLYDALMQAARVYCQRASLDCKSEIDCPWITIRTGFNKKCLALRWLDLLRKVRDGE